MNLLGRHITGLATFSGRENRQPFWLWILIVYAVQMVVGMVVMIPIMMSMFDRMGPMMQGDPHRFDDHPELVMQMITPMVSNIMVFSVVVTLIWLALIAAAVVRRLHDGDRSGWWASPVFAVHIVTPLLYLSAFPRFFDVIGKVKPGMTPDQVNAAMLPAMQSFGGVWLLGMVGFLLMIVLIVFLCLPGTQGANRYGEDPLAF
ncbi:DUF805 domain-containing protein [Sphingomonas bacterium]|uniref:DUF805 domain-containing protein n=1 Tax=Sphingomonas bacterium TaxID=1895847 RepID=UPI00260C67AA|nr:DUF805 domain-containing protein [Sphingomonas bacterium]MDB5679566.1 hypothetical protein [Sphingomonas bacterium]